MNPELVNSFLFMRKDPKFMIKLGLLSGAMFIPVLGWILALGYCIAMYRNCIEGKDDDMVLPEWEEFGNYVFKGVSLAAALLLYVLVFTALGLGLCFIFGIPALIVNTVGGNGASFFTSIIAFCIVYCVLFLATLTFGMAFGLFSETLEVSNCFKVIDVVQRVSGLGGVYYAFCATIAGGLAFSVSFLWFNGFFLWLVASVFQAYLAVSAVYGMSSLVNDAYHPELHDPTDIHIERSANMELDASDDEDEFGHAKNGKRSASYWAGRRPDTSLTWSTDSDKAE
ncbi:MAG: DUF4013 domain-containing protein [Candidatus Bruticola sp.]